MRGGERRGRDETKWDETKKKKCPCLKAWIKKESPDKMREKERRCVNAHCKPKWKYCGILERRRKHTELSAIGEEMPGYILKNTEGDCAAQHIINYTQSSAWGINDTHSICTYSTTTSQTPSDPDTAFLSRCKHRSWRNPFSWGQTMKSLYDHWKGNQWQRLCHLSCWLYLSTLHQITVSILNTYNFYHSNTMAFWGTLK